MVQGGFLPCDPGGAGAVGSQFPVLVAPHTDTDGLSSMWARRRAAMSPWASDSAEFPPCRTQEVRHHHPNEPLLPPFLPALH